MQQWKAVKRHEASPLRQVFALPRGKVVICLTQYKPPSDAIILAQGKGKDFVAAVKAHCRHHNGQMLANGSPEIEPQRFLEWFDWAFAASGLASLQQQIWVKNHVCQRFALPDDAELAEGMSAELDSWANRLWR